MVGDVLSAQVVLSHVHDNLFSLEMSLKEFDKPHDEISTNLLIKFCHIGFLDEIYEINNVSMVFID